MPVINVEHNVIHITDLEGDKKHLLNNLRLLGVSVMLIDRADGGIGEYINLPENTSLVFGGDLVDGKYDEQLLDLLLNTKDICGDRVTLIAGNRDLNKIRWPLEVTDTHPLALVQKESQLSVVDIQKTGPERDTSLPWVDNNKPIFIAFLAAHYQCEISVVIEKFSVETTLQQKIFYAKWMLGNTMGAPFAWRQRAEYLREEKGIEEPTDVDIFNSFNSQYDIDGPVFKYLNQAKMIDIRGNTAYMHGGLNEHSFNPTLNGISYSFQSILELQHGLNTWLSNFIGLYQQCGRFLCLENAYNGKVFSPLDTYILQEKDRIDDMMLPRRAQRETVITNNSMSSKDGMQTPKDFNVLRKLSRSHVYRLGTGHQPHINIPGVAVDYELDVENKCIKGFQSLVSDTCKLQSGNQAEAVLIKEVTSYNVVDEDDVLGESNRIGYVSYIDRVVHDKDGNEIINMRMPGIDMTGGVYSSSGIPLRMEDYLQTDEQLVGYAITLPEELKLTEDSKNKLFMSGYEITALNKTENGESEFVVCRAGTPAEAFQFNVQSLSSDFVRRLFCEQANHKIKQSMLLLQSMTATSEVNQVAVSSTGHGVFNFAPPVEAAHSAKQGLSGDATEERKFKSQKT
ncbi:MAG: hypothetical protein P1U74_07390 [Legionellaceae bacterium]|nr:hypothetical protein [Legionellaceae bacterium]